MLAEFFFPTDNVVDLPVECLLIFAFGLSPFSGPFRMLGRVVIVVFVPFIIWVEVHLIFKSERKFDNRIDIGVQFVFHIFTISVQVIEERIFSIIVARRIHSVWTIRIIDFICCKRRIVRTLSYIGRQCTFIFVPKEEFKPIVKKSVTLDSKFNRVRNVLKRSPTLTPSRSAYPIDQK